MRLLLILLVLAPSLVQAKKLKPLKILEKNKGVVFPYDPGLNSGDKLYVYSRTQNKKLSFSSELKIISCDLEECEAKVTKIKKNTVLSMDSMYSTKNLHGGGTASGKNYAWLAYGGPLTSGYNFGYSREWNESINLGAKVGVIDAVIGKVGVAGNYFALQADSKIVDWEKFIFSPYAEIGYMRTTLDFKKINGPKFDENVPYFGLGLNVWKFFDRFFIIGKAGYSYNLYKSKYSDAIADYTLPFKGGLIVLELGVGLTF